MIDYHTHTKRCGHAEGEMREYVERALEVGLTEIGFSDHLPLLIREDPSLTMSEAELEGYVAEVESLRKEYSLPIRLGIEADYLPKHEARTADLLARYPFDYVIGSVHFLDGWGFDDPRESAGYQGRRPLPVYREYFRAFAAAALTGLFDIMAHPDLIKKYDYRPDADISSLYEEAISAMASAGCAVEVNTAGLRKPAREIYPTYEFLAACAAARVSVVFGSDAHTPEDVGRDFKAAIDLARSAGYDKAAAFENRQLRLVPLI